MRRDEKRQKQQSTNKNGKQLKHQKFQKNQDVKNMRNVRNQHMHLFLRHVCQHLQLLRGGLLGGLAIRSHLGATSLACSLICHQGCQTFLSLLEFSPRTFQGQGKLRVVRLGRGHLLSCVGWSSREGSTIRSVDTLPRCALGHWALRPSMARNHAAQLP